MTHSLSCNGIFFISSKAIWALPIWTDHFSKALLFRFAMEIEGIFYVAEVSNVRHLDQLFLLDLNLIIAWPCHSRLMLWRLDWFVSDEHVHSKIARAPAFWQHFHSLATDWNRLITACSQLVNSVLHLFRQLMKKSVNLWDPFCLWQYVGKKP